MSGGPEFEEVEQPFLDQLASMGWEVFTGSLDHGRRGDSIQSSLGQGRHA